MPSSVLLVKLLSGQSLLISAVASISLLRTRRCRCSRLPGHGGASSSPAAPAALCRLAAAELRAAGPGEGLSASPRCLPSQQDCSHVPLVGMSTGLSAVPKRASLSPWCKCGQPCMVQGSWGCFPLQQLDPVIGNFPFLHDSRVFHFALLFVLHFALLA